MSGHTVVLLRSQELCEVLGTTFGEDSYTALRPETALLAALKAARHEAAIADSADGYQCCPSDYILCVAFEGQHVPVAFGWQSWRLG